METDKKKQIRKMSYVLGALLIVLSIVSSVAFFALIARNGPAGVDMISFTTQATTFMLVGMAFIYMHKIMKRLERLEARDKERRLTQKCTSDAAQS
jgi:ABC-type tungstate transport system substrate-binding protein